MISYDELGWRLRAACWRSPPRVPAASGGAAEAPRSRAPRAAGHVARAVPGRCYARVHRRVSALCPWPLWAMVDGRASAFLTSAVVRSRSGNSGNSNRSWRMIASARKPRRRSRCAGSLAPSLMPARTCCTHAFAARQCPLIAMCRSVLTPRPFAFSARRGSKISADSRSPRALSFCP